MEQRKILGYVVREEIGTGAGSQIYSAAHARTGQKVALKVVSTKQTGASRYVDQVVNEYKVTRALFHENIIRVHDLKIKRSFFLPQAYVLVMEHFVGKALSEKGGASMAELARVFLCVARGLAHMHSRGYVHADMKPENVLVGQDGTVKIIDFGVACKTGMKKESIQGTVDFIAPEQASKGILTPRTDIFNFGATMHKMFLKRSVATPLSALGVGARKSGPLYPSIRRIEGGDEVPQSLIALLNVCCEYDVAKRPKSMDYVIFKLEALYQQLSKAEPRG